MGWAVVEAAAGAADVGAVCAWRMVSAKVTRDKRSANRNIFMGRAPGHDYFRSFGKMVEKKQDRMRRLKDACLALILDAGGIASGFSIRSDIRALTGRLRGIPLNAKARVEWAPGARLLL